MICNKCIPQEYTQEKNICVCSLTLWRSISLTSLCLAFIPFLCCTKVTPGD